MTALPEPAPRRAPYAPVAALHGFLATIKHGRTPGRVDVAYLKGRSLAKGNEWALLSALKFLGIIDAAGRPTAIFRRLQGTEDAAADTLRGLVETAYGPLFEQGIHGGSASELRAWFARRSSASQAANATRFFLELCRLSHIDAPAPNGRRGGEAWSSVSGDPPGRIGTPAEKSARRLLISKLPSYREWRGTPEQFLRLVEATRDLALTL